MGQRRSKQNGSGQNGNGKAHRARAHAAAALPDIGSVQVKHLLRAPAGYLDIARQFAHALEATGYRAQLSPARMRAMIARGDRLSQRAGGLQNKATLADRQRMLHDAQLWKAMLSMWRVIVASMPDRPDLERAFGFMQAYMSVGRNAVEPVSVPAPAGAATTPTA